MAFFLRWRNRRPFSHLRGRRKTAPPISSVVEFLEDRTLLAAPTVINPIDDLVVYQDQVHRVAAGLDSPLYVTAPPGDFERLFIVEKTGQIRIFDLNTQSLLQTPFLDLPNGNLTTDGERGLLGLAFHPDYDSNGLFFVNFTDAGGNTVIARYQVSGDPNLANAASAVTIFTLNQPFANHNGGWMGFGPDGFLYVASGDGGSGNDPLNLAQNINDLRGKILRLDVNGNDFPSDPNRNYAIPATNPFVGTDGADEIWAYGLRNPWRPSFDALTGDFYIADVGQGAREEVNFQNADSPGGENYGWRLREGTIATPSVGGPRPPGAVDPVYEYTRGNGQFQGQSVTGGYVYRGPIEEFQGQYLFGDFISAQIWSIQVNRDTAVMVPGSLRDLTGTFRPDAGSIGLISSFGEDAAGNVYVIDLAGEIFQIVPQVSDTYQIDLSRVFSDPEGNDTYVVTSNSHTDSIRTSVSGTLLRLTFDRAISGDVAISVEARDPGGATVTDTFLVSFEIPAITVTGADAGGQPNVRVFNAETGERRMDFLAYDAGFNGGVRVATGDVNGDGVPDIITAAGRGGGPHVRVFNGLNGEILPGPSGDFFAYDATFYGGVYLATADFDLDGRQDIVTGAGEGGGPHVKVFSGADGSLLQDFFPYDLGFNGGVRVAAGDVNGDGVPDIITGAGPGGGPHVRIFDGGAGDQIDGGTDDQIDSPLGSFFPYDVEFTGGVFVAAAMLDGDNRAELITGVGAGGGPHVWIFRGSDGAAVNNFFPFDIGFNGGVRVGASNFNGRADVIVSAGPGGGPHLRIYDGRQLVQGILPETAEIDNYFPFDIEFRGGVFSGGATLTPIPSMAGATLNFVASTATAPPPENDNADEEDQPLALTQSLPLGVSHDEEELLFPFLSLMDFE